ncbi:fungal-specific transcription factor domain-containing protein [Paraphoma chrysanthemicola]|uniref:Fungal-specific transcription factor domain-containing protein n=1 Tax=Paraphoma chrysanthemicola TaxID=798071 RepID=A0A8K0RIN2_9PLEO|nr:fungal-specific transcription factor domain-containing protein [Paraphoma chrysanthemicola]
MGVKGCWTCRERKVRCDAQKPTCGNCAKARRECQGYGMQLSWPKDEDSKRAVVLGGADVRQLRQQGVIADPEQARFVNVRSWDVALALAMAPKDGMARDRYSGIARDMGFMSTSMQLPYPTFLPPTALDKKESYLLEFFTESTSLMLGPTDAATLAHFILQVALSGPESSNTTNTVLQAVFALSSLQLYGSGSASAFRYKKRVVAEIANAATDWLDETALLKNLIATMLLYHCEVGSVESSRRGTWVTFFCAVKRIINTSPVMNKLIRPEYSVFLDWIYYHEALSEFAVRHWKVPYDGCGFAPLVRSAGAVGTSRQHPDADEGKSFSNDVLELLVHACRQAIVPPCPEMAYTAVELERATVLEQHITMAVGDFGPIPESSAAPKNRHTMISDLHRVACLIYVNRAVHRVSATDFRHRRLVREGMLLMKELDACQSAWPLFIIGCEAIDDEQRLVVLNVYERIRRDPRQRSSHVDSTQRLVEAVWNQLDLDEEGQVEYTAILDAVIGGLPFMPLLA